MLFQRVSVCCGQMVPKICLWQYFPRSESFRLGGASHMIDQSLWAQTTNYGCFAACKKFDTVFMGSDLSKQTSGNDLPFPVCIEKKVSRGWAAQEV